MAKGSPSAQAYWGRGRPRTPSLYALRSPRTSGLDRSQPFERSQFGQKRTPAKSPSAVVRWRYRPELTHRPTTGCLGGLQLVSYCDRTRTWAITAPALHGAPEADTSLTKLTVLVLPEATKSIFFRTQPMLNWPFPVVSKRKLVVTPLTVTASGLMTGGAP